jgi:hypothetical protein
VDGDTLPTKVQGAFFSAKTILVVPEAQAPTARAARDALREAFPHGALDVVGVKRLRNVFDRRRPTRQRRIGLGAARRPAAVGAAGAGRVRGRHRRPSARHRRAPLQADRHKPGGGGLWGGGDGSKKRERIRGGAHSHRSGGRAGGANRQLSALSARRHRCRRSK